MVETLKRLEDGSVVPEKQNEALATQAPILSREDGRIDFSYEAQRIYDRWRGFYPWPGAHTVFRGKKLIVHTMHIAEKSADAASGTVVTSDGQALVVSCGMGSAIAFDEIQPDGKRRMSAQEFLAGHQAKPGERLGV